MENVTHVDQKNIIETGNLVHEMSQQVMDRMDRSLKNWSPWKITSSRRGQIKQVIEVLVVTNEFSEN